MQGFRDPDASTESINVLFCLFVCPQSPRKPWGENGKREEEKRKSVSEDDDDDDDDDEMETSVEVAGDAARRCHVKLFFFFFLNAPPVTFFNKCLKLWSVKNIAREKNVLKGR